MTPKHFTCLLQAKEEQLVLQRLTATHKALMHPSMTHLSLVPVQISAVWVCISRKPTPSSYFPLLAGRTNGDNPSLPYHVLYYRAMNREEKG